MAGVSVVRLNRAFSARGSCAQNPGRRVALAWAFAELALQALRRGAASCDAATRARLSRGLNRAFSA